jgi:phosphatidylglycerophosphate synthase
MSEISPPTAEPPRLVKAIADRLPDDAPRMLIDGMSKVRIETSPAFAAHLLLTDPEDRTWVAGGLAALVAATDMGDGKGSEWFGSTEEGNKLDKQADRSFVIPQHGILAVKGEIPRVHFALKLGREAAMSQLRNWGAKHGKSQQSRQTGREKTFLDMGTVVAAHSPLSQSEDLMRWGASMGTALSLTSFLETAFDYMKKDRPDDEPVTPRNSPVRAVTAGRLSKFVSAAQERFPGVRASHITQWSKRLVIGSAVWAMVRPDKPGLATVGHTIGSVGDALDGAWAREAGEDGLDGMLEDVGADLQQQVLEFAALSVIARKRGNKVAAANYALAAMTTPLSALTRAEAESKGYIVPEGGMGTRVVRAIMAGAGIQFNKHRDVSDIISAAVAAGNINTALERHDVVEKGADSKHCLGVNEDPEVMEHAAKRRDTILPYAKLGLALGSLLLAESGAESLVTRLRQDYSGRRAASEEPSAVPA